jgi:beta-galactosidase
LPVDFVSEAQLKAYRKIATKNMLSHYNIVAAPSLEIYRPELVKELEQYVINGGHLVLTCRSLQKDSNGHLLPTAFSEPLSRLAGVEVAYYDALPKNAMAELKTTEGQLYKWNNWGEILNTNTKEIETWATYTDQFYSGQIAVTHGKLGKGTVTYIGTDTDDGKLELDLITKIISKFEAPFNNLKGQTVLPDGLFIENRNGINVAINYAEAPAKVDVPEGAKILLGKVELRQGEVCVWE